MRKVTSFTFITLNGFLCDEQGDISWHKHGQEENQFAADSMKADNILLFGRKTYEMMASWWPTPMAIENDPMVAGGMNRAAKIVFSNTLKTADWENTTIMSGDIVEKVKLLKAIPGNDMTILGSGSILSLFASQGLIDDFLIMIDPVAIGSGIHIFQGINFALDFKLNKVQNFQSGVVLLHYTPK